MDGMKSVKANENHTPILQKLFSSSFLVFSYCLGTKIYEINVRIEILVTVLSWFFWLWVLI
jgi:hypothetical protein